MNVVFEDLHVGITKYWDMSNHVVENNPEVAVGIVLLDRLEGGGRRGDRVMVWSGMLLTDSRSGKTENMVTKC